MKPRLRAAVDGPDVVGGVFERIERGTRGEHPAAEDLTALALFAFARRRVVEHLQVNAHFRRLLRRSLRAGAGDDVERTDAGRAAERQRVVARMPGDLVEAADDGALRGGG